VQIEERVGHYVVIVSKADRYPLYLHMLGGEIVANAHYDEYEMNFTSFKATPSNDLSAFEVPKECSDEKALGSMPSRPLSLALASLVPGVRSLSYLKLNLLSLFMSLRALLTAIPLRSIYPRRSVFRSAVAPKFQSQV
jgi:hypothetical protein